jgi:succinyl-CoA synthetase beta subunit
MNLHEYQSKRLLAEYGVPVPKGKVAFSPEQARMVALEIGGEQWVVKAQIHSGGRGKAGGVKRCEGEEAVANTARSLLGSRLITAQTGGQGLPVHAVLVEEIPSIVRELYLGVLIDRSTSRVSFLVSAEGGMEIETVAAEAPEKILSCRVHPVTGFQPYQARQMGFALGLDTAQIVALTRIMEGLYRLFLDKDLSQIEINPLVVTGDGGLIALDAKISLDDNALFAHPELAAWRDPTQEDPKESAAREHGLSYVTLDGNIGCMVNGAGLAMATLDMIRLHGGMPANFLDVGGGTTAEKVAEAFKLIVSDQEVKSVLVNIFGGIVRCDLIAEGIIAAVREVQIDVPVVVRLEGTNAEEGKILLERSGLRIVAANDLDEAARKAVEAAA